jgi:hypothetical protein
MRKEKPALAAEKQKAKEALKNLSTWSAKRRHSFQVSSQLQIFRRYQKQL